MRFTREGRTNYNDCDVSGRLKISAAMKYMQQTSSEHLESIDMSPQKLYKERMVFLLSKMCVKIHRMPRVAEPLVMGTATTETRGARFAREFVMDSPEGERLASALSLWLLVDPETRKILRPANFPYILPFQKTLLDGAIEDMRFPKLLESGERKKTDVTVGYSYLDTNNHVNNSIYADIVCDALPFDKLALNGLDTLIISFLNEAKHGDVIELLTSNINEKEFFISGSHGGSPCFEALAVLK